MKRWYIAAVAGLCAVAPVRAQQGALAPTVPVVPAPVLHNGSLVRPAGGLSGAGRPFAVNNWSPVRSPVVPGDTGYPPAAVAGAPCGPVGCDTASCSRGFSLDRLKAWLCFNYSPTELPKLRPTPYVTPIQGLFGCSSGAGCAPCATGGCAPGGHPVAAPVGQPLPQSQPAPLQMPAPMKPPVGAGAVLMPPRGAPAPTLWQTPTEFGTVKGTTNPNGPVLPAAYPAPRK